MYDEITRYRDENPGIVALGRQWSQDYEKLKSSFAVAAGLIPNENWAQLDDDFLRALRPNKWSYPADKVVLDWWEGMTTKVDPGWNAKMLEDFRKSRFDWNFVYKHGHLKKYLFLESSSSAESNRWDPLVRYSRRPWSTWHTEAGLLWITQNPWASEGMVEYQNSQRFIPVDDGDPFPHGQLFNLEIKDAMDKYFADRLKEELSNAVIN